MAAATAASYNLGHEPEYTLFPADCPHQPVARRAEPAAPTATAFDRREARHTLIATAAVLIPPFGAFQRRPVAADRGATFAQAQGHSVHR